ncbi:contractile injection system tape measure protein [Chromobacterium haemolyticum]|uniref:contractile injection system tape measure protein n=1 Tax=Chromobacterium haemolyticum TaxID=394935 RepID=UPI0011301386
MLQNAQFETELPRRLLAALQTQLDQQLAEAEGGPRPVSASLPARYWSGGVGTEWWPEGERPDPSFDGAADARLPSSGAAPLLKPADEGHGGSEAWPPGLASREGSGDEPVRAAAWPEALSLADWRQYLYSGYAPPPLRQVLKTGSDHWLRALLAADLQSSRALLARLCLQATPLARIIAEFAAPVYEVLLAPSTGERLTATDVDLAAALSSAAWWQTSQAVSRCEEVSDTTQGDALSGCLAALPPRMEVDNAGLLLLWPLLPTWLRRWGFLEQDGFVSTAAQAQAITCLDAWLWRDSARAEWRTPFTKLLCGWPLEQPLGPWARPEDDWLSSLDELLHEALAMVPSWRRCGVQDIRHWFLQRPGVLMARDGHWQLDIEAEAYDILLRDFPWPIKQLSLPWMAQSITVNWG